MPTRSSRKRTVNQLPPRDTSSSRQGQQLREPTCCSREDRDAVVLEGRSDRVWMLWASPGPFAQRSMMPTSLPGAPTHSVGAHRLGDDDRPMRQGQPRERRGALRMVLSRELARSPEHVPTLTENAADGPRAFRSGKRRGRPADASTRPCTVAGRTTTSDCPPGKPKVAPSVPRVAAVSVQLISDPSRYRLLHGAGPGNGCCTRWIALPRTATLISTTTGREAPQAHPREGTR